MQPEQITAAEAEHGEGAVWWPAWGGLCWVDMLAGDVLHLDATGTVQRWHVGRVAAVLRPRASGGAVLATDQSVLVADGLHGETTTRAAPVSDPDQRFNEGACAPDGSFLCGTTSWSERPGRGALLRVDATGAVSSVLDGLSTSNGLAWTADGTTAYFIDSGTGRVDALDGDLSGRRPLVRIDPELGVPDGLTTDAEGGVWVALWEGGAVHRYDATGQLTEIVTLPVAKVTSCAFGGDDLSDLLVTTSRYREGDPHPAAGSVFRVATGVRGLPALSYAG